MGKWGEDDGGHGMEREWSRTGSRAWKKFHFDFLSCVRTRQFLLMV